MKKRSISNQYMGLDVYGSGELDMHLVLKLHRKADRRRLARTIERLREVFHESCDEFGWEIEK